MKNNFNKIILAAVLAMGAAFGVSGGASTKDNVGVGASEKTQDYDCIVKYQGTIEDSMWICKDSKGDFANNPSGQLKEAMNSLFQEQYKDYYSAKTQESMSLFKISIDDKGNLVKVNLEDKVKSVEPTKLGAAAYIVAETYDCTIKFTGEIANTKWSCKDENGKTIKTPSDNLNEAISQVVADQYKVFKENESEQAVVSSTLTLNSNGDLIKAVNTMEASSPTIIKQQREALNKYNAAKNGR